MKKTILMSLVAMMFVAETSATVKATAVKTPVAAPAKPATPAKVSRGGIWSWFGM